MKQSEVRKLQEELALENNKNPKDLTRIAELNKAVGFENEELTDLLMENRGWNKKPGGKYYSENDNKGFDHVFTKTDADGVETVLIVDSKQIEDGKFQLSPINSGLQLSEGWIKGTVLPKLSPDDPALVAIEKAYLNESPIKTAVGGLDKVTGEYKLIMVDVPSP